jgi:succinate dehydrogenase / fumarate reductase, iron-sulfur subunit
MNLTLKVWRQKNGSSEGSFATYEAREIIPDMSFIAAKAFVGCVRW